MGWLLAWCLVGCSAEIGGDDSTDAAPGGDASPAADAAPPPDAAPLETQTTVFSADDIADTFVRLINPTFNYGGRDRMCADTTSDDRRMLLRIDLSALPAGAQVVEATFHLWTGTSTNDLSTQTFSAYQMLEAWNEGTQDGAAGFANWNERKSGTAWTVAGAGVGSRDDVVMGSFVPAALDTEYLVSLQPELIQGWVDDPASNFGIVIVSAGADGGCFATAEFATASKHPSFVVTWNAP